MKARIIEISRGNAKVHARAIIEDLAITARLSASASCDQGSDVPVMLFEERLESDKRTVIIVVPILATLLTIALSAESESDGASCKESLAINPTAARWQSRLNYRLNGKRALELRDYSIGHTIGRPVIRFDDCIPIYDCTSGVIKFDDRLVQGTLFLPCELAGSQVTLKWHDGHFKEIPAKTTITATERIETSYDLTAPLWRMAFTSRIPVEFDYLVCSVVDSSGALLNGFEAIDAAGIACLASRREVLFGNAQADPRYHEWAVAQRPTASALEKQRNRQFAAPVRFSIIVPLYHTPIDLFIEMAQSVINQTYQAWELVLVNASPEDRDLAIAVAETCSFDNRVKAVTLKDNEGIALNTRAGIEAATGDFVAFLDHDDLLEPHALFEFACAIEKSPDADLIYSDEDRLGPDGRYFNANLKPDFTIDLLRCGNYICHFTAIRASMLHEIELPGKKLDGAQDFDIVLKIAEKTNRITHVPKVLYHWRLAPNSTAADLANKPYASEAGLLAVRQHLRRLEIPAQVTSPMPCHYRIDYEPRDNALVSIVIPSKDSAALLDKCLASIQGKTSYEQYEIVIVKNGGKEPETFDYYNEAAIKDERIRVLEWEGTEFNFSSLVNFGASKALGDYLLFLDSGTEVITDSWLEQLLGCCQRPEVGAVGARLLHRDNTIQHSGILLTDEIATYANLHLPAEDHGYQALAARPHAVSAVTSACLMTSRDSFEAVGGFSANLAIAYSDVDYCLKLSEMGLIAVYTPYVELYNHNLRASNQIKDGDRAAQALADRGYMLQRWSHRYAEGDPYLNPSLTRHLPEAGYYHLQW